MVLVTILILVRHGSAVKVDALEFIARIARTVNGRAGAQVSQFQAYNSAATSHFDVLPIQNAAQLIFKFDSYALFQVARGNHTNSLQYFIGKFTYYVVYSNVARLNRLMIESKPQRHLL